MTMMALDSEISRDGRITDEPNASATVGENGLGLIEVQI